MDNLQLTNTSAEETANLNQENLAPPPPSGSKGLRIILFTLLALLLGAGLAYGGYFLGKLKVQNEKLKVGQKKEKGELIPTPALTKSLIPTVSSSPQIEDFSNWKSYENDLGFSYRLPVSISPLECDQKSCTSASTDMPSGSTLTMVVFGPDTTIGAISLADLVNQMEKKGLVVTKINLQDKEARRFTGFLSDSNFLYPITPYASPKGGEISGIIVSFKAKKFLVISLFAEEGKDIEFSKDLKFFSQILQTFRFLE